MLKQAFHTVSCGPGEPLASDWSFSPISHEACKEPRPRSSCSFQTVRGWGPRTATPPARGGRREAAGAVSSPAPRAGRQHSQPTATKNVRGACGVRPRRSRLCGQGRVRAGPEEAPGQAGCEPPQQENEAVTTNLISEREGVCAGARCQLLRRAGGRAGTPHTPEVLKYPAGAPKAARSPSPRPGGPAAGSGTSASSAARGARTPAERAGERRRQSRPPARPPARSSPRRAARAAGGPRIRQVGAPAARLGAGASVAAPAAQAGRSVWAS